VRGRRSGGRNARAITLRLASTTRIQQRSDESSPAVGGSTSVRSFDIPISYTRSIGKLTNIVRADFNRSRTRTRICTLSTTTSRVRSDHGVSQNPFDWGLPNLSFTNFASLQDTTPQLTRPQTYTFSDNVIWNHGKHTVRWAEITAAYRSTHRPTAIRAARSSLPASTLRPSSMANPNRYRI